MGPAQERDKDLIFWRNLRPADLATLLAAVAGNDRQPQRSAGYGTSADGVSSKAGQHLPARERPLVSGGGTSG